MDQEEQSIIEAMKNKKIEQKVIDDRLSKTFEEVAEADLSESKEEPIKGKVEDGLRNDLKKL